MSAFSSRSDRAFQVLLRSIETAQGTRGEFESRFFALAGWLHAKRLYLAGPSAWRGCEGDSHLDTLEKKLGAIWWPPTSDDESGLLPVICGIARNQQSFSIRLAMVRFHQDEDFKGLGLRFEGAHGGSGSRHGFHHAQLFRHAVKDDDATRLTGPGEWLPEQQPSIPVVATNELELVWATAVSVYGRQDAGQPFRGLRDEDQEDLDRYLGCLG